LSEDLFLAAYTPEKLVREGQIQSAAAFGIYLIDSLGGRELIYRDDTVSCFSPIPIQPRPRPPVLPPAPTEEPADATGVFAIENVYQSTHTIPAGSIHGLRVVQVFPQTVETPPSRSITPYEMPKRIVGTAPVNSDGSVAFRAPARQPLFFQLVDRDGLAVMTMRSLVYLQPGERVSCVGCHESRHAAPQTPAEPAELQVHDLRPPAGPRYAGGLSFARTVQPVLDRYCIQCHGLDRRDADLDLLGTVEPVTFPRGQWPGPNKMLASRAYRWLVTRAGLVSVAHADLETDYSRPKDYFAHAGRLAGLLRAGHPDRNGRQLVRLDPDSLARIVDWLDLNAVCYGDYSWNKPEWRQPAPDGERVLREEIRRRFGSELAGQPFAALVNVALPDESRILRGPLAAAAGGWGLLPDQGWRDSADPDYQRLQRLVEAAIAPQPYHDVGGTCGHDGRCLCDSCWIRAKNRQERHPEVTLAPPRGP
jgi:hypothetical protein